MTRLAATALLSTLLAPAPYGVAINYYTQECAGYWGGDEYVSYSVPPGWTVYYPDQNLLIHTRLGTYSWNRSPEQFCAQTGYRYVSENIGEDRGVRTFSPLTRKMQTIATVQRYLRFAPWILGLLLAVGIAYTLRRRFRRP